MAPVYEVCNNDTRFLENKSEPLIVDRDRKLARERKSEHSLALIGNALLKEIEAVDHESCEAGEEDSFFVADLGEVVRSYRRWQQLLPRVQAHYAVKCNTDPLVLQTLGQMGASFDCASKAEIDVVLGLGFDAANIVYANPCKTNSFIRHAKAANVNLTTVDNRQELHKLARFHPGCKVLIRIATDDETAQCRLSTKFGCTVECALEELIPECQTLGLDAVGVAFHVGSGAKDFALIYKAIRDARVIFDRAEQAGFSMTCLDIGGGFERATFDEAAAMVNFSLEKYFPEEMCAERGIRIIAEPGRFMVADAFTLATHVIARRDLGANAEGMAAMLYMNDGVYGNLNCIVFDHQQPSARVLHSRGEAMFLFSGADQEKRFAFSLWGPTCDGLDCVSARTELPVDVQVGDWIYFPNVGAYTSAATTSFNGFSGRARVVYVKSE